MLLQTGRERALLEVRVGRKEKKVGGHVEKMESTEAGSAQLTENRVQFSNLNQNLASVVSVTGGG